MEKIKKVLWEALAGAVGNNAGLAVFLVFAITVVLLVIWPVLAIFGKDDGFAPMPLGALSLSILLLVLGYFFNRPEPERTRRTELTSDQMCYEIVKAVRKKHKNRMHFDAIYELTLEHRWGPREKSLRSVVKEFAARTKLLRVQDEMVYATDLAMSPDDRTWADIMIAELSQMSDDPSVKDLIEDLRKLKPKGLELVRSRRDAEETVRKAKAS